MTGRTALTALRASPLHSETPVPLSSCSAAAFSRCYDRCSDTLVFGRTENVSNRNPVQHVYLDDEDSRGVRDGTDAREHRNCLPCHCVSAWTGFRHAKQVMLPPTATTTHILSTNTIQSCPYLSLEKSTAATTTPDAVSVSLNPVSPELPIVNWLSSFGIEDRLPNSAGLFLRIRVLLI